MFFPFRLHSDILYQYVVIVHNVNDIICFHMLQTSAFGKKKTFDFYDFAAGNRQ